MNTPVIKTAAILNDNQLIFLHLKQLLRSVSGGHLYILLSFFAFTTVVLFSLFVEKQLGIRKKEKINERKQFLKKMIETRKLHESGEVKEKKPLFDAEEMLEHAF